MLTKNKSDIVLNLPKTGRYVRPSQFLNNFDNQPKNCQQNFRSSIFQSSKVPILLEANSIKTHKKTISLPLKHHNFNISQIETQETDNQLLNNVNNLDFKKQPKQIHKQIHFRNSILVVDLQSGVISKDFIDGNSKPLGRIRKNTLVARVKPNKLPIIQ